jgi:hypothetical protein
MTPNPHRGSDFNDFLAEQGLMTPTPRTDAAIKASKGQWGYLLRDLAQELERELAESTESLAFQTQLNREVIELEKKTLAELAAERALADRLAALLQRHREGYGGQVVDPKCDCCDCEYLGPIDASLAAWKEARRE